MTRASWRIAFVFYLFSHLANSAVTVAPTGSANFISPPPVVSPTYSILGAIPSASAFALPLAQDAPSVSSDHSSVDTKIIVASAIIGVRGILIIAVFLVLYTRDRRASTRTKILPGPLEENRNPFADPESKSDMDMNRESWEPYLDGSQTQVEHRSGSFNTVSTRQLYISNQMNRARKKLAELQEMSILLWSSSFTSGRQISTRASEIDDSVASVDARDDQPVNAEDPESNTVRDTLGHVFREIERDIETLNTRVRDEIHGLNSRIQKLERQRRSSWVMGLSDEGPPGYSE